MKITALLVIIFAVVLIVIGTFLFSNHGPRLRDIENARIRGELVPFAIDEQKPFEIQMGGIHVYTAIDQLRNGYDLQDVVYLMGIDYPFEISFTDEKLYVSAEIRNEEGVLVATIGKNQWATSIDPVMVYDRNYNSYAFEVIAPNQAPILQVVMTPQNKVFVGGIFYSANGTILAMLNGTTIVGGIDEIANDIKNYNQTIFQYPSEQHMGELAANSEFAFPISKTIFTPDSIIVIGYVMFGIGTFLTLVVGIDSFKKRNTTTITSSKPKQLKRKKKTQKRKRKKTTTPKKKRKKPRK